MYSRDRRRSLSTRAACVRACACVCAHVCAPVACAGAGLAPAPTSGIPVWARAPRSSPVLGPVARLGPPTCWRLPGVRLQHGLATGDFSAALSEAEFLLPAPDVVLLPPVKRPLCASVCRGATPNSAPTPAPSSNHRPYHHQLSAARRTPRSSGDDHCHLPDVCPAPPVACTLSNHSSGRDTPPLTTPRCPLRHSSQRRGPPVTGRPPLTGFSDCPRCFLWHELAGVCRARPWPHGHLLRGHLPDRPCLSPVWVAPPQSACWAAAGAPRSKALPQRPSKCGPQGPRTCSLGKRFQEMKIQGEDRVPGGTEEGACQQVTAVCPASAPGQLHRTGSHESPDGG